MYNILIRIKYINWAGLSDIVGLYQNELDRFDNIFGLIKIFELCNCYDLFNVKSTVLILFI